MIELLSNHAGTIVTGLVVLAAVAAVIVKLLRDKRNGGHCAGCGVKGCAAKRHPCLKKNG